MKLPLGWVTIIPTGISIAHIRGDNPTWMIEFSAVTTILTNRLSSIADAITTTAVGKITNSSCLFRFYSAFVTSN